jgi:glycosyltransferase involved in cell wall biosynthesis
VTPTAGTARRGRLLIIDARVPTPNRDGGSLRMFNLLRIFHGLDFDVSLVPSFPASFPPFTDTLEEDAARLEAAGVRLPAAGATVEEYLARADRFDVILMSGAFVAARHLQAVRTFAPGAALIYDTIDLHFLREYRAARLAGNVPRLRAALTLKRTELTLARAADATLVVSDRERLVLEREDSRIRAWVVPNVHEVVSSHGRQGRRDLLFLGAYTFDPNVDAMGHFVRDVLPAVRRRLPGIRLVVAGADPTPAIRALASEDVVVTGQVDDLRELFDRALVFVAPLRYGAGIKGKLLLSMAHGLPAVASPIAAEGIPARDGHDLLVAGGATEWADAVVRLHRDASFWSALAANGRALVSAHYSFDAVGARVSALVDAIGRRTSAPGGRVRR